MLHLHFDTLCCQQCYSKANVQPSALFLKAFASAALNILSLVMSEQLGVKPQDFCCCDLIIRHLKTESIWVHGGGRRVGVEDHLLLKYSP